MHVILPTRIAAQQLCDDLAKLLGIPSTPSTR